MASQTKPATWIDPYKYGPKAQDVQERQLGTWVDRSNGKIVPIDGSWNFMVDGENVRSEGAKGDGSTDDSSAISAVNTNLGASADGGGWIFFPPGTYKISSSITIGSATIGVRFAPGASLSVDSGITVTISGAVSAPTSTIFSGSGSISLSTLQPFVWANWFGVLADGSTDDSTAWSNAMAAYSDGGEVRFDGTTVIDTIKVPNHGMHIRGVNRRTSVIKLKDSASNHSIETSNPVAVSIESVSGVRLSNFKIDANQSGNAASIGLLLHNTFYDIIDQIDIRNIGNVGFMIGNHTGTAASVNLCTFTACQTQDSASATSGWDFNGVSKNNVLSGCGAEKCGSFGFHSDGIGTQFDACWIEEVQVGIRDNNRDNTYNNPELTVVERAVQVGASSANSRWLNPHFGVITAQHDETNSGASNTGQTFTDGSADFEITDTDTDLQSSFQTTAAIPALSAYKIIVTDAASKTATGWIRAIAKASDVYTLDVYDDAFGTAQNWDKEAGFNESSTYTWDINHAQQIEFLANATTSYASIYGDVAISDITHTTAGGDLTYRLERGNIMSKALVLYGTDWDESVALEFGVDDTTPSIRDGNIFKTNDANSSAITITNLDNGSAGQLIYIYGANNANRTRVQDNSNLKIKGDWVEEAESMLTLFYTGSFWIEVCRNKSERVAIASRSSSGFGSIEIYQTGFYFTNTGASAANGFVLPAAETGLSYTFLKVADQPFGIDPDGTETIGFLGAGVPLYLPEVGDSVRLTATAAGSWEIDYRHWNPHTDNSNTATSGTGEDNLKTYTIEQSTIALDQGLRIKAAGIKAGANDTKEIKLYIGSTSWTVHAAANNTNDWRVEAEMRFTSVSAQRISWVAFDGATVLQGYEATSEDTSAGDITVKLTGECVNASDTITQSVWEVERF